MRFGAELIASVAPPAQDELPELAINEISSALAPVFEIELINLGQEPIDVADFLVMSSSGATHSLAQQVLASGELLALNQTELGFDASQGDRIFLYAPGRASTLDGRQVTNRLRGRSAQHDGRWLFPSQPTFGLVNQFEFTDDIVINEIMYHHAATPESPGEQQSSELIALETNWRYEQSDTVPPSTWVNADFNDDPWQQGAAIFFAGPFSGQANPIRQPIPNLFSTGLDSSGIPLNVPGAQDAHYQITSAPGNAGPAARLVESDGFPIPPWVANDDESQWISHVGVGDSNGPPGTYTYTTTFDMSGFQPHSAQITLSAAADDQLLDVLLNGHSTGISHAGFGALSPTHTISDGFIDGVNTLSFLASNGGASDNPTGLRVNLSGTAVPLPANTELVLGPQAYYFRTDFEIQGNPDRTELELIAFVDDGATFYLNGVEVHRQNMPAGPLSHATPAQTNILGAATFSSPIALDIPAGTLVQGVQYAGR